MRSLCEHTVSPACLAVKDPTVCIDDLIEEILAAGAAADTHHRKLHTGVVVGASLGAGAQETTVSRHCCTWCAYTAATGHRSRKRHRHDLSRIELQLLN
jgi:hypothetical protein